MKISQLSRNEYMTNSANNKLESVKSLRLLSFGWNKDFVGRQSHIDCLVKIFLTDNTGDNHQRVALDGLGGVGKTQIALEFAFKLQEVSPEHSVFWVRASDVANFENSYRKIRKQLNILNLRLSSIAQLVTTKDIVSAKMSRMWKSHRSLPTRAPRGASTSQRRWPREIKQEFG